MVYQMASCNLYMLCLFSNFLCTAQMPASAAICFCAQGDVDESTVGSIKLVVDGLEEEYRCYAPPYIK